MSQLTHRELVLRLSWFLKTKLDDSVLIGDADFAAKQLTVEEFEEACELYKKNGKNTFYPKNIQQVVDLVKKPIFDDDIAQNIVSKIFEYQIKRGQSWADMILDTAGEKYFVGVDFTTQKPCRFDNFDEMLICTFGLVGFEIIRRENGWKNFCKNCGDFDKTILRPQLVRLAGSLIKHLEKTGSFEVAPLLSSGGPVLTDGNILKLLSAKGVKDV